MKKNEFRDRVDSRLASLSWDESSSQRVLRLIGQKEEKNVRHMSKKTMALVFALILMLLTTAAGLATGDFFGILRYVPDMAGNQAYVDTILTVGQQYECGAFTLSLNEAAFDGVRLTAAMEIHPKEGAEPVFVLPSVRAAIGGEAAEACWEGGMGFDEDGFWAPDISRMVTYPECGGAQMALKNRGEAGLGDYRPTEETVQWEITFDVYRPAMPIVFTEEDEPGIDEEAWEDAQYAAHEQRFADAYREGKIMLDQYADPWWYLACIPQKDGVDGGEKAREAVWLNAVDMGVFERVDQAVFRFETKPIPVRSLADQVSFDLPDGFTVTVEKMDVTVDWIRLNLRFTRTDGASDPIAYADFPWGIAVLAEDAETAFAGGFFTTREDGSLYAQCEIRLSQPTDRVFLVPCREDENKLLTRAVYDCQAPVTDEQKQLTVTIDLK